MEPKTCPCGLTFTRRNGESLIKWTARKYCSRKCQCAAQSAANDLAGTTFGQWTILERALGRDAYGSPTWKARHACGTERTLSSKQLSACRSHGCEPRCSACTGLHRPNQKRSSGNVCELCAGQAWRVVGPRCKRCRLLYEDEPIEEVDYGARQLSNLARVMGNS